MCKSDTIKLSLFSVFVLTLAGTSIYKKIHLNGSQYEKAENTVVKVQTGKYDLACKLNRNNQILLKTGDYSIEDKYVKYNVYETEYLIATRACQHISTDY